MERKPYVKLCIDVVCLFLLGYLRTIKCEVVYLCFDNSPSSVTIKCSANEKIQVAESLYVRSQWDACFYQNGAGDCSLKTDIGFDCCGETTCKVEAAKAYLPACGYSTLLRVVYECLSKATPLPCDKTTPIAIDDSKGRQSFEKVEPKLKLPTKKWTGNTRTKEVAITPKDSTNLISRQELRRRLNQHRQRMNQRARNQGGSGGSGPGRPARGGAQPSNRTAYGLLGSGILIIALLSGLLVFLWWRRRRAIRPSRFIPPSSKVGDNNNESEDKTSPADGGHVNRACERDIMVSVLPEAPPRRKRKRHFPSFLGIMESRDSKRSQPASDSLQDYDGESLPESAAEVPSNQRTGGRGYTATSRIRPDDYSEDMERLQRNFVTREVKCNQTTEI